MEKLNPIVFIVLTIIFSTTGAVFLFGSTGDLNLVIFGGIVWGIVAVILFVAFLLILLPLNIRNKKTNTPDGYAWFQKLIFNKSPVVYALFAVTLPVTSLVILIGFMFFMMYVAISTISLIAMPVNKPTGKQEKQEIV